MEQRFSHDFGHVRVHDDASAHSLAGSLGATAVTAGAEVFLGSAFPSLDGAAGQYVMAHELAHVVQRDRAGRPGTERLPFVSAPSDASEAEANQAAAAVMAGEPASVSAAPTGVAAGFFDMFGEVNKLIGMAGNHGDDPTKGGSYGPHLYSNTAPDGSTTNKGGFGHVEGDAGSIDSLLYSSQRGNITDGDSRRTGMRDSFTGGKFSLNDSWLGNLLGSPTAMVDGKPSQTKRFGADIGAFTANQEASWGNDGFTFGGGANLLEGSISGGTRDPNSKVDEWSRFGLSAGEGAALRGHWGDADKDGRKEYGFGFDAGPFSMDIKTEDPARTALRNLLPGGGLYSDYALDALGVGGSENLTDKVGEGASSAWNSAGDLWNSVPSIPDIGTGFGGFELPDMPSLPSLGTGFGGLEMPDLPSMPDISAGLPSMPSFSLPDFDW